MTLYFQDHYGDLREIAQVSGEAEAMKRIHAFCDERNFTIYYVRTWTAPVNGREMTIYDVGSHSEYFLVDRTTS